MALANPLKSVYLEHFRKILPQSGSILSRASGDDITPHLIDWTGKFGDSARQENYVVLKPSNSEQVSEILKFCNNQKIGVIPQGGNTGLVGGAVPCSSGKYAASVILSLSRLNRILNIDRASGIVNVEAGCILEEVDKKCREDAGLIVPVDLGAKGSCQIGGILATNAGGIRFLRYGSLHGSCLGMEVVLADGRILKDLRALRKDNTGYDLKQIFIGAEGTLGVITAAAIQAVPEPKSVNVASLQLESFEKVRRVFEVAREALGEILSAYEFWDGACEYLLLKSEHHGKLFESFDRNDFHVLIETSGSDSKHDSEKLERFLERVMSDDLVKDGIIAQDRRQQNQIWSRREGIPEVCSKQGGQVHKYDLSFPAARYYDLVKELREWEAVKSGSIKVLGFGHVGDGNIHINLISSKGDPRIEEISEFIFERTAQWGGSVSAEHGIGQAKRDVLSKSKGTVEMELMRSLKNLFDPNGILNPGKIII